MNPVFAKSIYLCVWPVAVAALLWVLPSTSNATVLTAGESAIFNFDFTSVLPANVALVNGEPLYEIEPDTLVSDVDLSDEFGLTYYDNLNGSKQLLITTFTSPGPTYPISFNISGKVPGLFDGIFSIAETVNTGAVDFGPLTVTGYFYVTDPSGGLLPQTFTMAGTLGFKVPEPPTLVLLILGLVALRFIPRRINTNTDWLSRISLLRFGFWPKSDQLGLSSNQRL